MVKATEQELMAFKELAQRFAKQDIAPSVLEDDRYPFVDFNSRIITTAMEAGILGITLAESYGGSGQSMQALTSVLRVIAAEDASKAVFFLSQEIARALLIELGPQETTKKWATLSEKEVLPIIAVPLFADPEELPDTIKATQAEEGYILTGFCHTLVCLPVAKAIVIPAQLEEQGDTILFLIELETDGVSVSDPVVGLGLRGLPVADLSLSDVAIPQSCQLGTGDSVRIYQRVLERFRTSISAIALGILEGAYSTARNYAQDRYQAKKLIIEHHMIRRMLSNMIGWIDIASTALVHACSLADSGVERLQTDLLSIQELVTKAATQGTTDGVQILGGYGYMHEYGQEKRMRDAKQLQSLLGGSVTRVMRIADRRLARESV